MMAHEEASTLLPNAEPAQALGARQRQARRTQAVRIAIGIISALALVAGSVVAAELVSEHQQSVATTSLSASTNADAQFGWGLWCSARATMGCMFSSDRDKCKEEVHAKCDPDDEAEDHDGGDGSGSGSGSGSRHDGPDVGDDEHHKNGTHHKKHHKKHHKTHAPTAMETTTAPASESETMATTTAPETTTTAPAEGETTSAPTEGETTTAPAEGETATAPAEGETATAPTEGETTTAPAEGETATAPAEGETTTAPPAI